MKFRGDNFAFGSNSTEYSFTMTGKIAASGSMNTLLSKDGIATNMRQYAFLNLFRGCTSLTSVPELPATTLVDSCYYGLFRDCTSLTSAPALPATTLANNCYYKMFNGCSSLSSVEVNFTDWSTGTSNWLNGVAASGTFTCPAALDTTTRDSTHVPADWTVVTK